MPTQRFPAEGILGILTANIPAYATPNLDGTDDIVLVAPDRLPCRAALVPIEGGLALYVEGDSADISGGLDLSGSGITLQIGTLHGGVHGSAANEMVAIYVPPHRNIPKHNTAPGMVNWSDYQ